MLERYLLGELRPAEKALLAQRLAGDTRLRERLESLRRETEEFGRGRDAKAFAHTLRERLRREQVYADIRTEGAQAARDGFWPRARFKNFAGLRPAVGGIFLLALVAVPAWRVLNGESSLVVHPEVPEASEIGAPPVAAPPLAEPGVAPEGPRAEARGPEVAAAREPERTRTDARTSSETPSVPTPVQAPEEPRVTTGPRPTEPRTSPTIARAGEEVTRLKGLEPTLALFRRTPR